MTVKFAVFTIAAKNSNNCNSNKMFNLGTGKTLMARALANECSQDGKRVAFFMRKGADCLSKWVGESERQLRLLFDQVRFLLYSTLLYSTLLYSTPLHSTPLHSTPLHSTPPYSTPFHSIVHSIVHSTPLSSNLDICFVFIGH